MLLFVSKLAKRFFAFRNFSGILSSNKRYIVEHNGISVYNILKCFHNNTESRLFCPKKRQQSVNNRYFYQSLFNSERNKNMAKRIFSLILALLLSVSVLASCGNDTTDETGNENESSAADTNETEGADGTTNEGGETTSADAFTTLDSVYSSFLEKLAPAFGAASGEEISGYFASPEMETVTETDPDTGEEFSYEMPKSGPGAIDLSNTDNLAVTLFPADSADKLSSAAVFFNMMNMNNGTFSAFELKDASEAQAVADMLKDVISGNMWMCGFPERYLIINIDGVIVSAFGLADATNALKDAIAEKYTNAVVLYDEAL